MSAIELGTKVRLLRVPPHWRDANPKVSEETLVKWISGRVVRITRAGFYFRCGRGFDVFAANASAVEVKP